MTTTPRNLSDLGVPLAEIERLKGQLAKAEGDRDAARARSRMYFRFAAQKTRELIRLDREIRRLNTELATAAEARHLVDPTDHSWERLAVDHPEGCSRDADYPGWAEHIAVLAAQNKKSTKEAS